MFIKLTKLDGSPVWIRAALIVTVEPDRHGGSIVVPVGDGLDYEVREKPEEVLEKVRGAGCLEKGGAEAAAPSVAAPLVAASVAQTSLGHNPVLPEYHPEDRDVFKPAIEEALHVEEKAQEPRRGRGRPSKGRGRPPHPPKAPQPPPKANPPPETPQA